MRAVLYDAVAPHHMKFEPAAPIPTPGPKQLLVRVHAAGINPVDYKLPTLPIIGRLLRGRGAGLDFSGVVERVGSAVGDQFSPGDRVYGNCKGSLADYSVADAGAVAKLPEGISHVDAASLPVVALTGLQSMHEHGFREGQRILIVGASGGTGAIGVQLAKCLGASQVTGICSSSNAELVRSLGADAVVDYAKGEEGMLKELTGLGPFDFAYDCVTSPDDPDYEPLSRKVLKPDSPHIAINGGGFDWVRSLLSKAIGFNLQRRNFALVMKRDDSKQLAQIAEWVKEGRLKALVEATSPLTEEAVHAAFDKLKSRRTKGKLVITVA